MKQILSLIMFISSLFPGILLAQKGDLDAELKILKSNCWTDGFEFVKYLSHQEAKEIWDVTVDDANTMILIGGTLHEGGTSLFVKHDAQNIWVDDKQQYQMFPSGDKITFDTKKKIILMRDSGDSALHGILKPLPGNDALSDLREMTIRNIRRLVIAGTYRDDTGKTYVFSAKENKVKGFPFKNSEYTLAEIFDFPNPIMIFDEGSYAVNKTSKGLELTPVRLFGDEGFYEPIPDSQKIFLKRTQDPMEYDYPLLSKEYFTLSELVLYGGDPYATIGDSDIKAGIRNILNALSTMRNEIFARHGYIFNSGKWKRHFSSKKWYKPTKTDISSDLSEIEETNIELIQMQEKKYRKQLRETE